MKAYTTQSQLNNIERRVTTYISDRSTWPPNPYEVCRKDSRYDDHVKCRQLVAYFSIATAACTADWEGRSSSLHDTWRDMSRANEVPCLAGSS